MVSVPPDLTPPPAIQPSGGWRRSAGSLVTIACAVALGAVGADLARDVRSAPLAGFAASGSVDSTLQFILTTTVDTTARLDSLRLQAVAHALDALDDPYAAVFTSASYHRFRVATGQQFGGLGVHLVARHGAIIVESTLPGGPAADAGLRTGDVILAVDTLALATVSFEATAEAMRGPIGAPVQLRILRPGAAAPTTVRLERQAIHVPSVGATALYADSIGYVALDQVGEAASRELQDAITGLWTRGARALVLDLRSNPGGFVDEAVRLAGLFLPAGSPVAILRARGGLETERLMTHGAPPFGHMPMVVLVGPSTASAGEILAGALQDHDRALVLGSPTYGKGSAQTIYPMGGGAQLKLTTALWYTPSGRGLERLHERARGVTPRADLSDSATTRRTDSLFAALQHPVPGTRQLFRTDGGRTIRGGPGIWPDTVVPDAVVLERIGAHRALGARFGAVDDSVYHCAIWGARLTTHATASSDSARVTHCADSALALAPHAAPHAVAWAWARREAATLVAEVRRASPGAVRDDAQVDAARALLSRARTSAAVTARR